jgi:phosphocarrier protein
MIEKELVVKDEVGLHARPASFFVKLAQEFNGTVAVRFPKVNKETGEEEIVEKDGKSMIGILSLGIAKDKPFTLVLDGDDEESFLTRFEKLLDSNE